MKCFSCGRELTFEFYDEYESIVRCINCNELNSLPD